MQGMERREPGRERGQATPKPSCGGQERSWQWSRRRTQWQEAEHQRVMEPKKGAAQGLWTSVWGSDCGQSTACASRTAGHSQGAREEEEVRDTGSHVALKIAACVGERTMCDAPASRRGAKKFWRVSEGHVACGSRRL